MQQDFDFVIIGAGAAGLTAAQYGARANLKTAVIESGTKGGQALLINELENYPGIFPAVNGFDFAQTMQNQAQTFGAQFFSGKVQSVDKCKGLFVIKTEKDQFTAKALLLATGAKHRSLGIPGEAELAGRGVSYCATCDGPFFKNKPMVVIGGGDAACDEANFLANLSDCVYLVHRRETLRAQAAVAERALKNPHIKPMLNKIPVKIEGTSKVEAILLKDTQTGEETRLETAAVFIFVGMEPQNELIEMARRDANGYIITDENMMTSIAGLFCAGDLRAKPFRQVVTAAADGAYAAHGAELYIQQTK